MGDRWWVARGETLWQMADTLKSYSARLSYDDGTLWGLAVGESPDENRPNGVWDYSARSLEEVTELPAEVRANLRSALERISPPQKLPTLAQQVLEVIARETLSAPTRNSVSGKALRLKFEDHGDAAVERALATLVPRFVERTQSNIGDTYFATLAGLLESSLCGEVSRALEHVLGKLADLYRANPDMRFFKWDELGAPTDELSIFGATIVTARLCQTYERDRWEVPDDIERVRKVRDVSAFLQYVRDEGQRRGWRSAPLRLNTPPAAAASGTRPRAPTSTEPMLTAPDKQAVPIILKGENLREHLHQHLVKGASFATTLGNFQIDGPAFGAGGNGVVFPVEFAGPAAAKFLAEAASDKLSSRYKRFQREYARLVKVRHEALVRLFHFDHVDVSGQEVPVILMERCAGTLGSVRSGGAVPRDEIVRFLRFVCSALEAIHGAGIIHRDLKPQNILTRSDGSWALADFGIAWFDPTQYAGTALTDRGERVANFEFSAPEQIRSEEAPTPAADIFAVGQLVYWLAFGTTIRAPGHARLAALGEQYADLDEIIERCVQQHPADRFQSARELLDVLDRNTTSVVARPRSPEAAPVVTSSTPSLQLSHHIEKYHKDEGGYCNRHDYELIVELLNPGPKTYRSWHIDVELPTALLDAGTTYSARVRDRSDQKFSLMRVDERARKEPLRPGDKYVMKIQYKFDDALFKRRQEVFPMLVRATAYAEDALVATVEKRVEELQNF